MLKKLKTKLWKLKTEVLLNLKNYCETDDEAVDAEIVDENMNFQRVEEKILGFSPKVFRASRIL